jgi:hypothetical protein
MNALGKFQLSLPSTYNSGHVRPFVTVESPLDLYRHNLILPIPNYGLRRINSLRRVGT